ncbi:MAG: hypothetical protein IT452_06645 [Planctomycetia bacterium]|nr:hypothetical protein [Planctomycetia bacterium]
MSDVQVPDGYKTQAEDTSVEAELFLLDAWRRWTPEERLRRVLDLNAMVRGFAEASVRRAHPHAADDEVRLRVASRRLGRELMVRVFGWDPAVHGY